ncbi:MAG: SUMF1/EgtB/PvdO family nonheme iron enzyme [Bacteroidetes bacterium]|jgi:formylglycine-generating enzyme|nr:SUMF1/EgtB/PvdO family nonheme iron enzyme [Bacteroidota bacterium]MBT6686710.1 SUMF1/EgtB/PvdO family nonheme iron enzyme [Bacteroidota bacterium]MBT7143234.1 SUMF1/EgtB/PvdO family nonheme iron enzyme [Bacteroidota bacterium]MBT7492873.1 SUMF1/EgtB/PvdO family nonheme iron enzyme [Bacteroidota bacterium]
MKYKSNLILIILGTLFLASCGYKQSATTGWNYNDSKNGGFEYRAYPGQQTGPGLVFIEGGSFAMGRVEQDVVYDWDNIPRRVTVPSFYMDMTEVRNIDYLEYLYWLTRVFIDYPSVYKNALPDTLVWRRTLAYNEPYVVNYFRHPAYREYPVVGVSWKQADQFTLWRTDRVNEDILINYNILQVNPDQIGEENFNSEAYLAGQYEGLVKRNLEDLNPNMDERKVKMEDGILLPRYRLPTEAEWEYAALALVGNSVDERIYDRKLYPWNGHYVRNDGQKDRGFMNANYSRGRGDMMGVAGNLNDHANITEQVISYWPNDYGLYCMAGNVNEWVMDVYRPMSFEVAEEHNPFRGNVYKTQLRDEEGIVADKDTLGKIIWREVTLDEAIDRRNYKKSDNINFLDGDFESSLQVTADEYTNETLSARHSSQEMYRTARTRRDGETASMINDRARVYKGGSWDDRAYWMVPGTRRFLDENESDYDLGFRCAMTRVGSPTLD